MPKYKLNRERPVSLSTVQLLGVPFGWLGQDSRGLVAVYRFVNTPEGQEIHRCWQEVDYMPEERKLEWERVGLNTSGYFGVLARARRFYLAEEINEQDSDI